MFFANTGLSRIYTLCCDQGLRFLHITTYNLKQFQQTKLELFGVGVVVKVGVGVIGVVRVAVVVGVGVYWSWVERSFHGKRHGCPQVTVTHRVRNS